jgi:crotonobetainyl-CoA:carnitine CoA-transferase CaiB-like acyl-CoA transferase
VSAFGHGGPWSELPGFDPIMQVLSGLATAQGGPGDPITITAPVHDVATGAIAALGIVGALLVREEEGNPQRVTTSLAAVSTMLQGPELTDFAGCPDPPEGGVDHPGPTPTHRFYRTGDGWLAVAATEPGQMRDLLTVVCRSDHRHSNPAEMTKHLAAGLATGTTAEWVERMAELAVPVSTVLGRSHPLDDPALVANDFSHIVLDEALGRLRVVRAYAKWHDNGSFPSSSERPTS